MNALDTLRLKSSYAVIGLISLNFILQILAGFAEIGGFGIWPVLASLVVSGISIAFWLQNKCGPTTRVVTSMTIATQVALLVYAFEGTSLQIDMHMYFFASLAVCAAWVDVRSILAYTVLVAVHHVVLFFAIPYAVFPGESDIFRVGLHAVILVVQSAVLLLLTNEVAKAFGLAGIEHARALAAQAEASKTHDLARQAHDLAEADRQDRETEKEVVTREILSSIEILAQGLSELSAGNLGFRIQTNLYGQIDKLRLNFNTSLENLETTLGTVGQTASNVKNGTAQIRNANDELAGRSGQQAAAIEEAAASLSEIANTVTDTAKRAAHVGQLVDRTKGGAETSAAIVTEAITAMSKIEESANEITQIIGVIDEIAFQTNLLALNAGVEAARAGDAGRGFAVVAQEVRELAQRSANAAKQIKTLINTSGEQVKQGVDLVGKTGGALRAIATEVNEIATDIRNIVESARDQSAGLVNITATIGQIDRNSQQNTAMIEESARAVHALAADSETLGDLLTRFQTGTGSTSALRKMGSRMAA